MATQCGRLSIICLSGKLFSVCLLLFCLFFCFVFWSCTSSSLPDLKLFSSSLSSWLLVSLLLLLLYIIAEFLIVGFYRFEQDSPMRSCTVIISESRIDGFCFFEPVSRMELCVVVDIPGLLLASLCRFDPVSPMMSCGCISPCPICFVLS